MTAEEAAEESWAADALGLVGAAPVVAAVRPPHGATDFAVACSVRGRRGREVLLQVDNRASAGAVCGPDGPCDVTATARVDRGGWHAAAVVLARRDGDAYGDATAAAIPFFSRLEQPATPAAAAVSHPPLNRTFIHAVACDRPGALGRRLSVYSIKAIRSR